MALWRDYQTENAGFHRMTALPATPTIGRMLWKQLRPYVLALVVMALISGVALWIAGPQTAQVLSTVSGSV